MAIPWRAILDDDLNTTYAGTWVGLYGEGREDPIFVVQCTSEFTPLCLQYLNVSLPIPAPYFTVGTHSRCLMAWERPVGDIGGIFHVVKNMHTTRGPKKDKEEDKEEITFFYGKVATLTWDPDRWRWGDGGHFLNYTTKSGREIIASRKPETTRAGDKWQKYLPGNYRFFWAQV